MNRMMLESHYKNFRSLPEKIKRHIRLTVVDDGSPKGEATAPAQPLGFPLNIYRIDIDVRWNQDAARNIGVRHASTNWLLLTDMDHLIPEETLMSLSRSHFDDRDVYTFRRLTAPNMQVYKPHPNSWFMSAEMWERIGGYDERLAGYYGTDGDFRARVVACAREIKQLPLNLIRVPRELVADASTTTYERKRQSDYDAMKRIKDQRAKIKNWRPMRYLFPYHKVFP